MEKIKVGVIGCGNISGIYFKNMMQFDNLEVVACADIVYSSARAKAEEFNIKAMNVKEILSSKEIRLIVNLTIPKAHAEIALASLKAGKCVYNEKPLAIRRTDAQKILKTAKKENCLLDLLLIHF